MKWEEIRNSDFLTQRRGDAEIARERRERERKREGEKEMRIGWMI